MRHLPGINRETSRRGFMKHIKFIVGIIIGLIVLIIVVQNHEAFSKAVVFKIDLLGIDWKSAPINLYYIVTISFLFGLLIAAFYGIIERFRLKKRIKTLASEVTAKDQELNSLRNLPITSEGTSELASEITSEENGPEKSPETQLE
jgi:uncharacterized integral membrane protein